MFNNLGRVITTMFIWGVSLILNVIVFYMWDAEGLPPLFTLLIVLAVLAMTTHTTAIIWKDAGGETRRRPTVQVPVNVQRTGKAKRAPVRDEKLALLLELMDESERRAFKRALQEDYLAGQRSRSFSSLIDGELPFDVDPYFEPDDDRDDRHR